MKPHPEFHFLCKLSLDAVNGLRINGQEEKLRGACIYHDNGIVGACTFPRAEERRCRLLKEAGFNCIRNSHHPLNKAMLDACVRQGMLIMDELSDMWEHPKNINDYAMFFHNCWEQDH
ncbi:glycoside hydrolase family 2 TIM barrel-domain containing protein [Eisenbergiella porci]|uniref:glycoside hydrolase family 2 TIM barrel-domain containing protein n=1 Tax=Eisenbergiella porci TaxID=2652274 RepID=UPI002A7FCEA2|nr:glycoside hydrolase family 2 TIM barrel-domain containing protein [Eisenbergiella porci]